jgi:hypothetical protein
MARAAWTYDRRLLRFTTSDRRCTSWPRRRVRVRELAPAFWQETLKQEDTQQRLATNVFRRVSLGMHATEV